MHFALYLILIIKICLLNSEWIMYLSQLIYDQIYENNTGVIAYSKSGGYLLPSTTTTANFITCKKPSTSYITLTQSFPSAQNYQRASFNLKYFLQMDLFFQGTWISDIVTIRIGAFSYQYQYTSPTNYTQTSGFCDDIAFEVRTVNITSPNSFYGEQQITSQNNQGQVSIRNYLILRFQCYPSCVSCIGPKFNQCTHCFYGVPINNICPHCPSNKYYIKYSGCKDICDIASSIYYQGFCQDYYVTTIQSAYFSPTIKTYEILKWSIVYDSQNVNPSPKLITISGSSIFGIFTFKSGIYRSFNLNTQSQTFLIGLKIYIAFFNQIPINCGIQFKINNTYYGSIYRNDSGIQTHKVKIYENYQLDSYSSYISNYAYDLITYLDIPQSKIIFQAVGNYTNNNAGWGVSYIQFTSGYCPQNCLLCEVSFKCKTCANGYYFYREASCSSSNQKLIGSYCYETKYSQYLIQEFKSSAFDIDQYQQYKLVSQSGTNFLKGQDIFVSFWQGMIVFGVLLYGLKLYFKEYMIQATLIIVQQLGLSLFMGQAFHQMEGLYTLLKITHLYLNQTKFILQLSMMDQNHIKYMKEQTTTQLTYKQFGNALDPTMSPFMLIVEFMNIIFLFIIFNPIVWSVLIGIYVQLGIAHMIKVLQDSLKKNVQVINVLIEILLDFWSVLILVKLSIKNRLLIMSIQLCVKQIRMCLQIKLV